LSGVFIDITEQKMAEAEARLQREEVTHLVRVSTLGELSGAIAHEISQPLTAILANAQAALHLMRQETPDLTEVEQALEESFTKTTALGRSFSAFASYCGGASGGRNGSI